MGFLYDRSGLVCQNWLSVPPFLLCSVVGVGLYIQKSCLEGDFDDIFCLKAETFRVV